MSGTDDAVMSGLGWHLPSVSVRRGGIDFNNPPPPLVDKCADGHQWFRGYHVGCICPYCQPADNRELECDTCSKMLYPRDADFEAAWETATWWDEDDE